MQTDKAMSHSFNQRSLRDRVCISHVVRATVRLFFFLLADLPMKWRCWQVALLWDMCGNNKLGWQTHTCMHVRHGVRNRLSVTLWHPQHINNAELLTNAGIKLLTLSPTSFLTFFLTLNSSLSFHHLSLTILPSISADFITLHTATVRRQGVN